MTATSLTEEQSTKALLVKGRNASGRSWKTKVQGRASALVITNKNKLTKTWDKRQELKQNRKEQMALQKELHEESRKAAIQKKERRLENEKRRAENEYKNVQNSVQTLNYNTANHKLQTMSKKQLRQIKKTRVNTKTGVVEYVPAYQK
mmetsp:Transcript_1550/g.2191  ORF Transcript_1550/g.2191 Transcript_1550/m.2191 type:complete len:148 (-) Transcript_1550:36-479(-)